MTEEDITQIDADLDSSTEQYTYDLKIPKDRVAVLIGKKGEVKKGLEQDSKSEIIIDSKEGEVRLVGKDSIALFALKEVIRAIARGFNPEIANLLLRQDYSLELISLNEFNDHKNHQLRLKGRVIGRNGKSRSTIEEMTGCYISVYGKTVGIIGSIINVPIAKKAVESLLMGSMHASVYKWLEKQKRMNLE